MEEEPCYKKPKLADYMENYDVIVNNINQIQSSTKNLKAVVSEEFTNPVEITEMIAGNIKNRKDISKAIKVLNDKLPLNTFSHLKRVRNDTVLICPKESMNEICIQDYIKSYVPELADLIENFKEVLVPKHPVRLKKQCLEMNKIWSCNFHPDAYLERLTGDNFFSDEEVKLHRLYMTLAIRVALWYFKTNKIENVTETIFKMINVAVIVDPSIDSVVAIAVDNRSNHPMQHAAMLAIDNVAKTQNGGAWNCNDKGSTDCVLDGIDKELLDLFLRESPDIKFGAKKFISKQDLISDEKTTGDGPYLCTNYHVYMISEPCLMCAMALVHARVKRVFFSFNKPDVGALISKAKLHTVSMLNHHYEVFTGFL